MFEKKTNREQYYNIVCYIYLVKRGGGVLNSIAHGCNCEVVMRDNGFDPENYSGVIRILSSYLKYFKINNSKFFVNIVIHTYITFNFMFEYSIFNYFKRFIF